MIEQFGRFLALSNRDNHSPHPPLRMAEGKVPKGKDSGVWLSGCYSWLCLLHCAIPGNLANFSDPLLLHLLNGNSST